jgi:hypothetical protein
MVSPQLHSLPAEQFFFPHLGYIPKRQLFRGELRNIG